MFSWPNSIFQFWIMECGILIVWYPKQCDSLNFREKWYSNSYNISNIIISRFQVKKILISIPGNEFLSWGTPHLPDAIIIGCRDGCTGCTNEKHDNAVPAVCCICQLLTVLDFSFWKSKTKYCQKHCLWCRRYDKKSIHWKLF